MSKYFVLWFCLYLIKTQKYNFYYYILYIYFIVNLEIKNSKKF